MKTVSIIGASGYTGGELVRVLSNHPKIKIAHCTSESSAGENILKIHPSLLSVLRKKIRITLEKMVIQDILQDSDLVFLCLPHGSSAKVILPLWQKGVKVIDLSADLRLRSAEIYGKWYGLHPRPSLLGRACYGLPELHREEIRKSSLVANPGCYATATLLSLIPLIHYDLVHLDSIIVDAKSGVSGAGKKLETRYLFSELDENFLAYSLNGHRHLPEIVQELKKFSTKNSRIQLTFVPHLLPIVRGILVTTYSQLKKKISRTELKGLYSKFYHKEAFVHILKEGEFPEVKSVQNSNDCQIGVHVDEDTGKAVVIGVLDNLGKGASSQAVQNMNLMLGFEETLGLV